MTRNERIKAQIAMMLLTEKRCGKIKVRMVFDGRKTREWITKEDSASPTATLEGILLMLTIDAHENRDVMSADVPNACYSDTNARSQRGRRKSDDENHRSVRGYANSIGSTIIWASRCI